MGFQNRAKRWPSAWQLVLEYGIEQSDQMVVEIRNVSASGCAFAAPVALPAGTRVQFDIAGARVSGFVVRQIRGGGAIAFNQRLERAQLENLRQVRKLKGMPRADAEGAPSDPAAQSDEELRRLISGML